jgi:hypothetical protein
MGDDRGRKRKGLSLAGLWRLALALIGVFAIVQELRRPPQERTWHGKVGIVPYDFRFPTVSRLRDTHWNPDAPLVSGKSWGFGWTLNFGAAKKMLGG